MRELGVADFATQGIVEKPLPSGRAGTGSDTVC
jgi:hypothetical protein